MYHDSKYDKKYSDNILRLISYSVEFMHPTTKELISLDIKDLALDMLEI